jgi:hypothetical protein
MLICLMSSWDSRDAGGGCRQVFGGYLQGTKHESIRRELSLGECVPPAAERTGRKAQALEVDPASVDVAVWRWQSYTSKAALNAQGDSALIEPLLIPNFSRSPQRLDFELQRSSKEGLFSLIAYFDRKLVPASCFDHIFR